MNIFVTDPSPYHSAVVLPDKHIVKMPLETCQMLAIVCSDKWGHNFGTLPRADGIKCPNKQCPAAKPEIVYIQYDKEDMKYIYVCLDCYKAKIEPHVW